MHAWHPYYAGYSESFVKGALSYLHCEPGSIILDPWGGSGTTTIVASREQVPSLSVDINPVMATFSAAKSVENLYHKKEIFEYLETFSNDTSFDTIDLRDPLHSMYHSESSKLIRSYIDNIPFPASYISDSKLAGMGTLESAVRDSSLFINPIYAFCKAALFISLRKLAGKKKHSNPTWVSQSEDLAFISKDVLVDTLHGVYTMMFSDIENFFSPSEENAVSLTIAADTRQMPILDNSIDYIVTSPPYLTRIDYAVSTTAELSLLGNLDLVEYVRHKTMGAPVITKDKKEQLLSWGSCCNDFLNAVASHQTKAAKSYYWKNLMQYFVDMDQSLTEIARVLKPGAKGLIVVQSSYFKDVEAKLGEMYVEMAQSKGLLSSIAFREEVKNHLAHVNTKSSMYKANKIYFEDFVYIEKPLTALN